MNPWISKITNSPSLWKRDRDRVRTDKVSRKCAWLFHAISQTRGFRLRIWFLIMSGTVCKGQGTFENGEWIRVDALRQRKMNLFWHCPQYRAVDDTNNDYTKQGKNSNTHHQTRQIKSSLYGAHSAPARPLSPSPTNAAGATFQNQRQWRVDQSGRWDFPGNTHTERDSWRAVCYITRSSIPRLGGVRKHISVLFLTPRLPIGAH